MTTHHNLASDANAAQDQFAVMVERAAAQDAQFRAYRPPHSATRDSARQAYEDAEQAAELAKWAKEQAERKAARRKTTWRDVRSFVGMLVILAVVGFLFWLWVQPGTWLR